MIEKKSAQQRREHTQNTLQKSDITQKKNCGSTLLPTSMETVQPNIRHLK